MTLGGARGRSVPDWGDKEINGLKILPLSVACRKWHTYFGEQADPGGMP